MLSPIERTNQYIFKGVPVSGGKGGDKAVGLAEYNQGKFQQTLMSAFKTQFANQQDIQDLLKNTLTPQLTNPTGFSQADKAAMNSQVINQSATDTQNALKATQANAAARGGATSLPSGVQEQIAGQINASGANETSAGLTSVQQQDAQLKEQNYLSAISGLSGLNVSENPLGYAGGATSAASSIGSLNNDYMASRQFNDSQNFGSALGQSLQSAAVKGLSGVASKALFGG